MAESTEVPEGTALPPDPDVVHSGEAKKAPKGKTAPKLGVLVKGPGETPADGLSRDDWAAASLLEFGVAPEVARHAMEPDRYYTREEAQEMIERFLARPVSTELEA